MSVDDAATLPADEDARAASPKQRWWHAGPTRDRLIWLLLVPTVIAGALGGAFALLPGQMVFLSTWGSAAGLADCAGEHGALFVASCPDVGVPVGQVTFEGLTPLTLSYWISRLPGINPYAGYQLTGLLFLALGAAGCIALTHELTERYWPGAIAAVAFLSSPVALSEPGLSVVSYGVFLLPAALWALLQLARPTARPARLAVVAGGAALVALAVLNTSGYSYLHLMMLVAVIGGARALLEPTGRRLQAFGATGLVLTSGGVAGLMHRKFFWPDVAVTGETPLEFFRGGSVDLVSMALPSPGNHLWGRLGAPWGEWAAIGDDNAFFLGWIALVLAVIGIAALARRRRGTALGLAAAITVSALLALGPSLRVDDPWPPSGVEVNSYQARLMPAEEAALDMPWAAAFKLPPLDLARVVRRWAVPLQLTVDLAAAAGLAHLSRPRSRRAAAVAGILAVALLLESADDSLPGRLSSYDGRLAWASTFTEEVLTPLDDALPDDARTLYLPSANDYLAVAVGPLADLRLLNVNGDKNVVSVRAGQDPAVRDAKVAYGSDTESWEAAAKDLMDRGLVDALVLGDFSLRWASYQWPPSEEVAKELRARHEPAVDRFASLGCDTKRLPRVWVVTC